jgi:hypothetical protein
LALANAGLKQGHPYFGALTYLQNTDSSSVDSLSRQIMALNSVGVNVTPLVAKLNQWQNGNNAWGAYKGYGSSLPDTPLAMLAEIQTLTLNTTTALNTLCAGLMYAQRADNSFSYLANGTGASTSQATGSLIPTLYAMLALNATSTYAGWGGITCPQLQNNVWVYTTFTLNTMVTNATTWLLGKQSATDGGFGDFGQSTLLETALAYQVLNKISPVTYATQLGNAQGYLIAQQKADGSWGTDPLATALAMQTLPTLAPGTLVDSNKNGIPDVVESFLGLSPTLASRTFLVGNGQSILGLTASQLIASGSQYQPFTYTITASGGTAPYTWRVASGYLPDGLLLNATTGQITGTPTTAGTFNFGYTVTDSTNAAMTVGAQIQISQYTADNDVPTLPEWAAIILGLLLMSSVIVMNRRQHN